MKACIVCGQPITAGREDKMTCSGRCRTKRYRHSKSFQPTTSGSWNWRQGERLAKIARFRPILAGDDPYRPTENYYRHVPPEFWDTTLELMNKLFDLDVDISNIEYWQGDVGRNSDPITGEVDGNENDICAALMQHIVDIRNWERQLYQIRGKAGRIIAPSLSHFTVLVDKIVVDVRRFVATHEDLPDVYTVNFSEQLMKNVAILRELTSKIWFDLYDKAKY